MTAWQVTAAFLVLTIACIIVIDILLVIFTRPTISRVVKDYIGKDPKPYWVGSLLGALVSHFANW